ncbi:uncharacterized protein DUF4349 [Haloactinopolyspora alba]|uniref:Uncharacterized protein DUF4349 n=1 Tax=Haloactinopolyspora alba TaxID=648780 RepID=A0A2P8E2Q1_9ACTN|nr:DUF4349 domain-containing protein [Haloactinopolyspora alba]PSL03750.1 uncharacterized protein DUF4349 [Haloactinopolyspora alba]
MRRTTIGAAALVLAVLAGCSGGESETADSAAGGSGEAAPEAAAPDEQAASSDDSGGVIDQAAMSAAQRHVIHTVDLSIRADDVPAAAQRAADIATGAGGLVADERRTGDEHATLTLRVPADDLDAALERLTELGEVTHRTRSAEDVTQEVVDTESRVTSQRASIERLRTLLDEAGDLSDVIAVERELSKREADLDALLTRQEQLAQQTSLATVTVELHAPSAQSPGDDDRGFLAGLGGGWDAFVSAGAFALTALGAVLPFAVLAAAVGYPALVLVRRRRQPGAPAA